MLIRISFACPDGPDEQKSSHVGAHWPQLLLLESWLPGLFICLLSLALLPWHYHVHPILALFLVDTPLVFLLLLFFFYAFNYFCQLLLQAKLSVFCGVWLGGEAFLLPPSGHNQHYLYDIQQNPS